MTKVMAFDKANSRMLHIEAEAALQAVAAKYGLTLRRDGGRIDAGSCKLSFAFGIADPVAAADHGKAEWNKFCAMFDLKPEQFGQTFTHRREPFRIVGIIPNRPKFCVRAVSVTTGRELLFPASAVMRAAA